jgi:myosin heavy chain 6/7
VSQKEARSYSTELFKLRSQYSECQESIEALRRENKNLADEIKDLMDQLSEGGKSVHEIEKSRKRLELEKDELQVAIEAAESALEQEEAKVSRIQIELTTIRMEIDKRLREKDDEFENTRKNHQRVLESMQASLDAENKGKCDALRQKKKLEGDINELEIALDIANRQIGDLNKSVKNLNITIIELQVKIIEKFGFNLWNFFY